MSFTSISSFHIRRRMHMARPSPSPPSPPTIPSPPTPIPAPPRSPPPSPPPAPAPASSSTGVDPNDMMNRLIQQHRRRGHATRGRMATTPLTQEQIRRNAMEDAREYHEERSENLTNDYQRGFRIATGHAAMMGHWSSMFTTPVSELLTAFASTPSIAVPAILNI